MPTSHIRGPSVFQGQHFDFKNVTSHPKVAKKLDNLQTLKTVNSQERLIVERGLLELDSLKTKLEALGKQKEKLYNSYFEESPGELVLELNVSFSRQDSNLKALEQVMSVLS